MIKVWLALKSFFSALFMRFNLTYVKNENEAGMIVARILGKFDREKVADEIRLIDSYISLLMDKASSKNYSESDVAFYIEILKRIFATDIGKAYLIFYILHDISLIAKINAYIQNLKKIVANADKSNFLQIMAEIYKGGEN